MIALLGFWAVFNSTYVQSPSQFTNSWDLGESTQLCVWMTENSVERGASANHDFKGRFFVLLGVSRRFQHHICQITRTVHILVRPG